MPDRYESATQKQVRRGSPKALYAQLEAIRVDIDQYAEAALGNREFFLNKPHSIG